MENLSDVIEAAKGIGKKHKEIIEVLLEVQSSSPIRCFKSSEKLAILKLQNKGIVQIEDDLISLTDLGRDVDEFLQVKYDEEINSLNDVEKKEINESSKFAERRADLEMSNQFLELYKQGFNRREIMGKYGVSYERVQKLFDINPAFHEYEKGRKKEKTKARITAELERIEKIQKRSIASLYPERVVDLWDFEKNHDLDPEKILASSAQVISLKCPIDGHSWKKKASDITAIWKNDITSGCPACIGKGSSLIFTYPDRVAQYWDYEKNNKLEILPNVATIGSTKKAWFKCPIGHEWKAIIGSVTSAWRIGNNGCKACIGKESSLISTYPDRVAQYWDYEKNNELEIFPDVVTNGSQKKACFKCPIDGYEWKIEIVKITKRAWRRGRSGCQACKEKESYLISTYPDRVAQYWDYEKNDRAGVYPDKLTRGSIQEAWFKCPIDGYEWKTRIGSITKNSWSQGNSGCTRCLGWNIDAIRQFVASLEVHIPNLTQAELYKIFEQSGVLDTTNTEGLKIVKDIIKGKLTGQKLRDVIQGKESQAEEAEIDSVYNLNADAEIKVFDTATSLNISFEGGSDSQDVLDKSDELPKLKVQKSLEFLNSKIVASSDQEAIDFFIASKRNQIWAKVFEDDSEVKAIEAFTDDGYGRQVRDQFLDEYYQAKDMVIPSGWAFRVNGKITLPNLMQKLAAVHLRSQQRMLNLSLTGTGKTIGGILSSRIIDAHLTIIICPLDTISDWKKEIEHVFPDSRVTIKNFNPHWEDIKDGHHYILLNHEMFQQPSSAAHIRQLLERYQIDLIIVDEIHRCKQRSEASSKRRDMVKMLITKAAEQNPDLHVLGMSATPVINNLKEGKSLVELVTGLERADLGEKATINNCMRLHQAFVTLGIRSKVKPKIKIDRVPVPVDCTHLVDRIREEGTSILKMEQILTSARIPTILKELSPRTIVYTHYVEGIVDMLTEAIEEAGWTVGFHIGGDKSGHSRFINGSVDILIASSAMATGVDGLQKVCDRLILNIPPWTSAELEQLEGRLNRQGQTHDTLTIISPVTYGLDAGEHWSWDEGRLARHQNKRTVAAAAVDGVMPEGQLRSESQAFRDLRQWLERLKTGEQKSIIRPKIFVPLPDVDPVDHRRRNTQYGDFRSMNARWNSSKSDTNYKRLQGNPEDWMQYHTLYQSARKTWSVIPYEEAIKWLKKRSNLIVADLGCGEALLAKALAGKHTVHSFDFIAINDSVIECDIAHLPLEDACLDVAMFNLSLMGLNITDYIREATRTLKLDGQLWIYEVKSRIKDLQGFVKGLELAGFRIIENTEVYKFQYIQAIKSEEVDLSQISIQL
jgi:Hypothetical methyltransferase/Probable Zinc-ribbon domain/Type III restriction enzyme, res subunit